MVVSLIQSSIGDRHATRYVISLNKVNRNGKERYYQRKNMGKGLQTSFKAIVNDILQALPVLVESGSEVSYFIPEPRNFTKVTRLLE